MEAIALAKRIEHAVLQPQATAQDVLIGVQTAVRWGVRALVVKPCHVALAARELAETSVKVVTVIGFPHGGQTVATKVAEAREAIAHGADEVDLVLNIGPLRDRNLADVFYEIRSVVDAVRGRPVKVILETAYLTDVEKRLACRLAARAGAAYVKTSTGFGPKGATVADVALMRRVVGRRLGIKAAGGIRTHAEAVALLEAGADLVGTSHTDAILREAEARAA
ncbi:MAG: deoxyribose-phosphate aldolase [Armatimonadota bacterium]|nr:deoxyribose-phosphate aldolase [Armatimonadota bacterium]MDR7485473.1 deoxyribose-phosphate aldolase [Armatimonadota bacterium]MDR7533018.1 deoxyribose-phosphate aldolase [Armatimonadota bacterium]MDR7536810.1 deoxyribose-phosphate aldolase [Armatimonadota bacterium]